MNLILPNETAKFEVNLLCFCQFLA